MTTAPKSPATGPEVTGCVNPNPGKVLLTFDDGGPKAAAILAILDRYQIKARWFPTGQWANANGAMIQRLIADGQMLGNHTYSHPQMLSSLGRAELTRQVDLGYHPTKVFRFPYGASDATSRAIVTGKGYSICGWSIDTLDWRGNSADAITRIVTTQAQPGSVVLMHMAFQADVDALPRIIDNLRSRGLI
jgi:peptidoglycan-N-acetylglucosamine deacetylase